jgi:hypothetical protein
MLLFGSIPLSGLIAFFAISFVFHSSLFFFYVLLRRLIPSLKPIFAICVLSVVMYVFVKILSQVYGLDLVWIRILQMAMGVVISMFVSYEFISYIKKKVAFKVLVLLIALFSIVLSLVALFIIANSSVVYFPGDCSFC